MSKENEWTGFLEGLKIPKGNKPGCCLCGSTRTKRRFSEIVNDEVCLDVNGCTMRRIKIPVADLGRRGGS